MFNVGSNNLVVKAPFNNGNNYGNNFGGNIGSPYAQSYNNDQYWPIAPWSNPTYSPTYSPTYRYRLPPYRLPPYYPPIYNYPVQTVPQIQTIPYPQYIPVPYLTDPLYYEEDDWDDPGHSCNTVVSHLCHRPGGRRGRRRRGLVYDPYNSVYVALSSSPWDWPPV